MCDAKSWENAIEGKLFPYERTPVKSNINYIIVTYACRYIVPLSHKNNVCLCDARIRSRHELIW